MAKNERQGLTDTELCSMASRAKNCRWFRWMPGMADVKGRRVIAVDDDPEDYKRTVARNGDQWVDVTHEEYCTGPDLSDPATKGCISELVRGKVFVEQSASKERWIVTDGEAGLSLRFESHERALLCALEKGGPKLPTGPQSCPFCGSSAFVAVCEWRAESSEDKSNCVTLDEYQCRNEECGRSWWT